MKKYFLLDCTLRDGGYINDWEFGHNKILNIYERLVASGVDIIEVGFIDDRRPYDINRSIYPDTRSIKRTYEGVSARPHMLVGMIDYGTCAIDNVEECSDSILDGIRVIFKKHLMHEAMEFISELKAKGYHTFAQLVAVSEYTDYDIEKISALVNEIHPYAVSMVDTYGLLYPDTMLELYRKLDERVDADIPIGFHAHNNLQLGYANVLAYLNHMTDRDKIVDGTLYGMGKSAGNDPIELVVPYLNQTYDTHYDVAPMLEAIEESIKDIYISSPWGYRTQFYLSAENECHPNYVSYLQAKDNLSIADIKSILSMLEITEEKNRKLYFDRDYIEDLYQKYLSQNLNDDENARKLRETIGNRPILIVGPGKNLQLQKDRIDRFIAERDPVIISVNFIPDQMNPDYLFLTKKSRYQEMTAALLLSEKEKTIGLITTSNVNPREKADFIFDREPLLERKEEIIDNSFLMLLRILKKSGIKEVNCAGLDGYSDREDNYFQKDMEYSFVKNYAVRLNHHIKEVLATEYRDISITFITYSHYMETED